MKKNNTNKTPNWVKNLKYPVGTLIVTKSTLVPYYRKESENNWLCLDNFNDEEIEMADSEIYLSFKNGYFFLSPTNRPGIERWMEKVSFMIETREKELEVVQKMVNNLVQEIDQLSNFRVGMKLLLTPAEDVTVKMIPKAPVQIHLKNDLKAAAMKGTTAKAKPSTKKKTNRKK